MSVEPLKPRRMAIALPRTAAGRFGATAVTIFGGIIALDVAAIVATLWFGADLIDPAELARAKAIAEQLTR